MSEIKFDECRLNAAIIHESRVPEGDVFAIFDPALSDEKRQIFPAWAFSKLPRIRTQR